MTIDGTTLVCPVDPATSCYAEEFDFAGEAAPFYTDLPDPAPGAAVTGVGRRSQLLLCEPVTHRPLAELATWEEDSWGDEFGPGHIAGTIRSWDPGLHVSHSRRTTSRGRTVGVPDLKGLEVALGLDGFVAAVGILQEPHDIGGGVLGLRARGPQACFDERTLGETEQADFYEGRGSFPTEDLTGWDFEDGVEHHWNTTTPWEGDRSLMLRSTNGRAAWAYAWEVAMDGQDGFVRHPVASSMLRSTAAAAGVWVACWVTLPDGTPVRPDFSIGEASQASDDDTGWQGPIPGRGWLTPEVIPHKVRAGILLPADGSWVQVDFLRLQWPTLTGFPVETDLAKYPGRILRDAQYRAGGSPWGIADQVDSLTGSTERISWAHQNDHPVANAMGTITDRDDGPDMWIRPTWTMHTAKRRGRDRRDIALTPAQIIDCTMSLDPGAEIDEMRALTELGAGPTRIVHGLDQARRSNRRRVRSMTHVQVGLGYDAGRAWTRGRAEFAAREQFSFSCIVDYEYALRFNVGDGCVFAWDDGHLAWWGPVRVGSRTFNRRAGTATLTGGIDPVVDL